MNGAAASELASGSGGVSPRGGEGAGATSATFAGLSPLWRTIFRVVAIAGAAPLLFAQHLPFADAPEHVATIATLRHWFTPGWRAAETYVVDGASQYLLYDLVGAALAFPLETAERANFVIVFAAALAFPYALAALLSALGRDARFGLMGVPLFWSRVLGEGLLPFVVSIPVALLALALAARHFAGARRPTALAILALTLFYLHISSFLLFVLAAAALALLEVDAVDGSRERTLPAVRRRIAVALARLRWLLPSLLAVALFAATSPVTHPDRSQGAHAETVRFLPKRELLAQLGPWMHDFWASHGDNVAAVAAWTALLVAALAGILASARDRRVAGRWPAVTALVAIALAFYFFMPTQVGFAFLLDLRMAPFVGAFGVLLAMPPPGRVREATAALVAAAALGTGLVGMHQMRAFEREEARHIDTVLKRMPEGKRLLSLVFDARSKYTTVPPHLHIGAYYRARFGGVASFSFAELPHWPVRYRTEVAPPTKPIVFWDFDPCQYRNTVDGPHYDYVLVRGRDEPFTQSPGEGEGAPLPGPVFDLVGGARDLRRYERRADKPVVPGVDRLGPCYVSREIAAR